MYYPSPNVPDISIFNIVFSLLALFFLAEFILLIISAIITYRDAKYRGQNAVFWTVFDIFSNNILFPIFYYYNIVKPYNKNQNNIYKRMPIPMLLKTLCNILMYISIGYILSRGLHTLIFIVLVTHILISFIISILWKSLEMGVIVCIVKDARNRKERETLWGILSIFFSFIVCLVYIFAVIKRKKYQNYSLPTSNIESEQLTLDTILEVNDENKVSNKIPLPILIYIILSIILIILYNILIIK